jgi:hypothetical protein
MQDVQARLGAQAVNSMINTKRFPEGRHFVSHSLALFSLISQFNIFIRFPEIFLQENIYLLSNRY